MKTQRNRAHLETAQLEQRNQHTWWTIAAMMVLAVNGLAGTALAEMPVPEDAYEVDELPDPATMPETEPGRDAPAIMPPGAPRREPVPVPPTPPVEPRVYEQPTQPPAPYTPRDPWRIRAGSREGIAFAFGDSRYLITHISTVHTGAALSIRRAGRAGEGEGTLMRKSYRLGAALVRSSHDVGQPLPIAEGSPVGARLTVVTRGEEPPTVLAVAEDGDFFRVGEGCRPGAALVDAGGNLVGMCTQGDRAVRATALREFFAEAQIGEEATRWRWRASVDLRYRFLNGYDQSLGVEVALGAVGYDRIGFLARAAYYRGVDADNAGDADRLERGWPLELGAEVQLHQAFRMGPIPTRLVIAGGGALQLHWERQTITYQDLEPGCTPGNGPCRVREILERPTERGVNFRPYARAEINLGAVAFSYTATFDLDEIGDTLHTLGLGLVY